MSTHCEMCGKLLELLYLIDKFKLFVKRMIERFNPVLF